MLLPQLVAGLLALAAELTAAAPCDLSGTWRGHPAPTEPWRVGAPIAVVQDPGSPLHFTANGSPGTVSADGILKWGGLEGNLSANTAVNATAPPCTRITWNNGHSVWCKEPWCERPIAPPPPGPPLPPPPPPTPAPKGAMNVLFIAVDDLRAQFGRSFQTPEVLTPNIDAFFLDGGGAAMQHSYVQVAVCGISRHISAFSARKTARTYPCCP